MSYIGVVHTVSRVGSEIFYFMSLSTQILNQLTFEFITGVIGSNSYHLDLVLGNFLQKYKNLLSLCTFHYEFIGEDLSVGVPAQR